VFCREQRASGRLCFAMSNDFLCTVVFCGLWLLIRGGTELLEVLGMEGQDIHRYPGAR
jgi:hypothetical protein